MSYYNLEFHKNLNKSHILPNLLNGAKMGVLSQFLTDIILSILLYNEEIIINDIKVSSLASYYASVTSGALVAFLSIYMDPFAIVLFSTFAYAYVYQIMEYKINKKEIKIRPREIIFDTGVSIILIYSFDPIAHNQYLRYQQKKHYIEPTYQRMDRSITQTIFFITLVSTYGFLKIDNPS